MKKKMDDVDKLFFYVVVCLTGFAITLIWMISEIG